MEKFWTSNKSINGMRHFVLLNEDREKYQDNVFMVSVLDAEINLKITKEELVNSSDWEEGWLALEKIEAITEDYVQFKSINKTTEDFEKKFWKAKSAESFNNNLPVNSNDPATLIFKAAMAELLKTKRQSSAVQTARVERILEIATDNEIKKIEKNFTFLATIGSTAPFIGLFGTVWGIMN